MNNGIRFRDILDEKLKDPEFKAEFDSLLSDYALSQALQETRKNKNLTQKQLAKISGIDQADISRIENGDANPSLKTLNRLADAMDCDFKFQFVPKTNF